jgi:glutamate-1-semialdehyde 2,1-aminomutase
LRERVELEIERSGAGHMLSLSGHPAWVFTMWNSEVPTIADIKHLFMQEMSRHGVLMIASHNVMAAHSEADLDLVVDAYAAVLPLLVEAEAAGDAVRRLDAEVGSVGERVR